MNARNGLVVGRKVLVLASEQISSLSGLSVFQRRKGFLQLSDYGVIVDEIRAAIHRCSSYKEDHHQAGDQDPTGCRDNGRKFASLRH